MQRIRTSVDVLNHDHPITSHGWSFKLWIHIIPDLPRLWLVLWDCYSRVELHITSQAHWELFYIQDFLSGTTSLYFSYTEWDLCRHADLQAQRQSRPFRLILAFLRKLTSQWSVTGALLFRPLRFDSHATAIEFLSELCKDMPTGWAMVVEILKTEFLVPLETCFSQSHMIHWHISNVQACSFFYSGLLYSLLLLPLQATQVYSQTSFPELPLQAPTTTLYWFLQLPYSDTLYPIRLFSPPLPKRSLSWILLAKQDLLFCLSFCA